MEWRGWEEFHRSGIYISGNVSPYLRHAFEDLPRPTCVIEVGCGTGRNLEYLREAYSDCDICATDVSPDAIEKICADNIEKSRADMRDNPFNSECFSHSLSWRAVHNLDEKGREEAFEELRRLTRKGGYLIIAARSSLDKRYGIGTECEKGSFVVLDQSELPEGEVFYKKDKYQPWHFFRRAELINLLERNGFGIGRLDLMPDEVSIPSFYTGTNLYWMAAATRIK